MSSPTASRPKKKLPMEGGTNDAKKSYVLQPRQTDVLCGRGGMSNHHAGNEWYRRLIKSNRPLYKACPKHTKLLVAKAVVQAVEQQGGRFLDKEKQTGLWYIVEYKRAVDKTSQGLREKDRSGSESDDDEDFAEMVNPPTDVNVLARQISQADPAPGGNRDHTNGTKFAYEYPGSASYDHKPYASADNNNNDDDDNLEPLPPTMEPRQTSMFRFLQSTKLLSSESGSLMDQKPAARRGRKQFKHNLNADQRARAHQAIQAKLERQLRGGGDGVETNSRREPSLTVFQSQVSDWLTSFWPVGGPDESKKQQQQQRNVVAKKRKAPPEESPTDLETGASQVLLQMATSSKLFRGFSSLFEEPKQPPQQDTEARTPTTPQQTKAGDSLLDDYEESPMEKRMRTVE